MKTDVLEKFYLEHAADGALSDADMVQMLTLGTEGDTAKADSGEPDATTAAPEAPTTDTQPQEPAQPTDPKPVVLAKDGVHTIDFAVLEEARQKAQTLAAALAERDAEIAALKAPAKAETPEQPTETEPDDKELFGDYSDEAIKGAVKTLVQRGVAQATAAMQEQMKQVLTPLEAKANKDAWNEHLTAIYTAHKDAQEIAKSPAMETWLTAQPSFVQAQYRAVLEMGSATQVIELFDAYKRDNKVAPAEDAANTAAAAATKAREALAKAQSVKPTSLSEIPSGAKGPSDELQAMQEMSSMQMADELMKLPYDKIMKRLELMG
ncbi:MAG: hypothetical protein M0P52_10945 [Rhodoferax sp.]|nr:hypothetical protein [Rhodoferax sp.]